MPRRPPMTDICSLTHRLAALVKHVSETRIQTIIDRLIGFTASKDEGVRDIASLGELAFSPAAERSLSLTRTCFHRTQDCRARGHAWLATGR